MSTEAEKFAKRLEKAVSLCPIAVQGHGKEVWIVENLPVKITPKAVNKWFRGESMPRPAKVYMLADLLGASREWLLTGVGSPERKLSDTADLPPQLASLAMQCKDAGITDLAVDTLENLLKAALARR